LGESHVVMKIMGSWFATYLPAAGNVTEALLSKPQVAFKSAFSMPQLLGDCRTGRNDVCCSILKNRKQKSWKFCLLKFGKDGK
jgi:hypothetical protein